MKRQITLIIALSLLLSMTACGNVTFENQEEMFTSLKGIWVVDDLTQNSYYIFDEDAIYNISDAYYRNRMSAYMTSILESNGLDALYQLDYPTVINSLSVEDILGKPCSRTDINCKRGIITLNKDESNERILIIEEAGLAIKNANDKHSTPLKKLSDTLDFSIECFEKYFIEAKESFTIPTSQFWTDTKTYGAMVKAYNPEIDGWELTTDTKDTIIYTSSKWVPSVSGTLLITDDSVTYTNKVTLLKDWNPTFSIIYTPNKNKLTIIDQDNISLDIPLLFQYAAYALKDYPGGYEDYMELYDAVATADGKTTNGTLTVEKNINGITYKVLAGTNGYWASLTVTANDSIKLSELIKYSQTANKEQNTQTPPQTNPSEPTDGNTTSTQKPSAQYPAECLHNWRAATCTEPEICTLCGETAGSAVGHNWRAATCTEPEICTVCGKTGKAAQGHQMNFTKCSMCDYINYSCIAGTYTDAGGYGVPIGTTTMVDINVTNVSVSDTGILCFTCNEKDYTITIRQNDEGDEYFAHFDCYIDGVLLEDTCFKAGNELYYHIIHLYPFIVDGCRLYINAKPSVS